MTLIMWDDPTCQLGLIEMDETHREFVDLVNKLADAKGCDFENLFQVLVEHTRQHFAREKEWMEQSGFPAISAHEDEYQRILGELNQYKRKVSKGAISFARGYVSGVLPDWFKLHIATMDSALAFHLKQREVIEA